MISALYVDDDPSLLELGRIFLGKAGDLVVETAQSGSEALDRIGASDYDIVISDYQMPGMDGLELLKIVRVRYPSLPFIIFTGRGREEVVIDALNNGADHYIQKGGDPKSQFTELIHTIRAAVDRNRSREAVDRFNRLYSVTSRINRAIIHIRDQQQLLDEACRIAVEEGRFLMAWIGMVDPATRVVHPVAACGYEAGYLSMLTITVDNVPQGMGLTGQAIRENHPTVCNDIRGDSRMERYRSEAARRGYCSSAGFPLRVGGRVIGAMRFYAGECNFFNEQELSLLGELTDDISFALEMMDRDLTLVRLREMHDELALSHKKLSLLNNIIRHDILNTVTGLIGLEDMAAAQVTDEKVSRLLSDMKETTGRIRRQIAFTGDYQRIGVKAPQWQELSLCIIQAKEAVSCGKVRIGIPQAESFAICADPMLEKVFYNLLDNALRYGGEKLSRIVFEARVEGPGLLITCEDDGQGVPAADKEKIFQSGFGKNTGQGLFLAREILGISKITIRETGTPGSGARFEIAVPEGAWRRGDHA